MNWTKTKPTESGYYWWRMNRYKQEGMYYVFFDLQESINKENAERTSQIMDSISRYAPITEVQPHNRVFYARWVSQSLCDKEPIGNIAGEWYGPIKLSEEILAANAD